MDNELLWECAEHWLQNWENPRKANIRSSGCALCKVYLDSDDGTVMCYHCPIADFTGYHACGRTPWHAVARSLALWRFSSPGLELLRMAIEKEYRFLVCLALGDYDEARELCKDC